MEYDVEVPTLGKASENMIYLALFMHICLTFWHIFALFGTFCTVYFLALVCSIPSRLVWAYINRMVHVVLPKRSIDQFKPVQQIRLRVKSLLSNNIYNFQNWLFQLYLEEKS